MHEKQMFVCNFENVALNNWLSGRNVYMYVYMINVTHPLACIVYASFSEYQIVITMM